MAVPAHRIYVYGEQQVAAMALLDECGMATERWRIQRVNFPQHLAGLDRGTFLVVSNHPTPVPAEIMLQVELIGMVVFELDDRFARAKAEGRYVAPATDAA
jgi:hypothetical protein